MTAPIATLRYILVKQGTEKNKNYSEVFLHKIIFFAVALLTLYFASLCFAYYLFEIPMSRTMILCLKIEHVPKKAGYLAYLSNLPPVVVFNFLSVFFNVLLIRIVKKHRHTQNRIQQVPQRSIPTISRTISQRQREEVPDVSKGNPGSVTRIIQQTPTTIDGDMGLNDVAHKSLFATSVMFLLVLFIVAITRNITENIDLLSLVFEKSYNAFLVPVLVGCLFKHKEGNSQQQAQNDDREARRQQVIQHALKERRRHDSLQVVNLA